MLRAILFALLTIAAATFVVETAFLYVGTAKRLLDQGLLERRRDLKLIAYFWLAVGAPADVLFNWTRGCWEFRELPRELTFSARVQRHIETSTGARLATAQQWAAILNAVDPGHIRLPVQA